MRKYVAAMILLLLALPGVLFAKKDETLDELIVRANAAKPDRQPDLFADVAEREMTALVEAFKAGRSDELRADLQQVVTYCDRAQAAAIHSHKHVKRTEIRIRVLSQRLQGMRPEVDPDDTPAVQAAIDRLEHFRAELFRNMFGLKDDDHE